MACTWEGKAWGRNMGAGLRGEGEAIRPTPAVLEGEEAGVGVACAGLVQRKRRGSQESEGIRVCRVLYEFVFSRPNLSHPSQING